ncbi:DUF4296 domain-containing protein [Rhodohalobacter mucosus]|uniref:DUF4296 domain-containing protein n=1 Tax=Rhodohalobacter mucosus TaxID=2079485 RepID=A0A316TS14_9BACT|nr:DUF4296 domain-containing protein [Rhodohalobacter mucosus]PWN06421.1 hypothetical protein DDZ15_07795 [Rhodohalobacter mucosus]
MTRILSIIRGSIIIFLLLLVAAAIQGCSTEPDVLEEEVYGDVLIELTIVNHMDESQLGDRTPAELRDSIFQKYGVTREEFRSAHDYYQRNMQNQMLRIEEYSDRLRAERDSIQEAEKQFRLNLETERIRDSLNTEAADTLVDN